MAFVHEIQFQTRGFPGGPGFTNLYFAAAVNQDYNDQFTAVKQFIGGLAGLCPSIWSAQINPVGRLLEANTGTLAQFTTPPPSAITVTQGNAGSAFGAGVAGVVLGWASLTINRARLVRGRTFVVPVSSLVFEADGTIAPDYLTQATATGQGLIDAQKGFAIWSRPRLGVGGLVAPVTSVRVNDRSAFLSSRRA